MIFTVTTLFNEPFAPVAKLCLQSLAKVSEQMQFHIVMFDKLLDTAIAPSWNKLLACREAFNTMDGDWLVWIDADCIVHKPFPLWEDISSKGHMDMLTAQNFNGLTMAMFAIKKCDWSKRLIDALLLCGDVRTPDQFGIKHEENTVKAFVREFPNVANHIGRLSPEFIIDQPEFDYGRKYPIHHFGARGNDERVREMSKYGI